MDDEIIKAQYHGQQIESEYTEKCDCGRFENPVEEKVGAIWHI
jgi:hypothetical protein